MHDLQHVDRDFEVTVDKPAFYDLLYPVPIGATEAGTDLRHMHRPGRLVHRELLRDFVAAH